MQFLLERETDVVYVWTHSSAGLVQNLDIQDIWEQIGVHVFFFPENLEMNFLKRAVLCVFMYMTWNNLILQRCLHPTEHARLQFRRLHIRHVFIHSFLFSKCFTLLRVVVFQAGVRQKYILNMTPVHRRTPCTQTFRGREAVSYQGLSLIYTYNIAYY